MNNRFFIGMVGVFVAGSVAALLLRWYSQTEDHAELTEKDVAKARLRLQGGKAATVPAEARMAPIDPSKRIRLAFGPLGLSSELEDRQMADLLTAELSGARGLELVERRELDKVLGELGLGLSGVVRAKDAARVGKLLHADWFLLGASAKAGTNRAIVARVVDARTGVMRDVGVFELRQPITKTADEMRDFVCRCRQASTEGTSRIYLALGAFEDLSVNSRQTEFARQLRAYLTAAYRNTKVTLLERELVATLLDEVRLDLAGLTDQAGGGAPSNMQSAFWQLDGYYQSYETTNLEVELVATLHRIFGRSERFTLREPAGDALCQKVKTSIDRSVAAARPILAPSRTSEFQAVLQAGRELTGSEFLNLERPGWIWPQTQAEANRERHNAEEAIRAFETALLFEPNHHEAKMYLGALLQKGSLRQMDKSREYYREVIDDPAQDQWSEKARTALIWSFTTDLTLSGRDSSTRRAIWFGSAMKQTANPAAANFYRAHAEAAEAELAMGGPEQAKADAAARERLGSGVRDWAQQVRTNAHLVTPGFIPAFNDFSSHFKTNRALLAKELTELLPKLQQENPDVAPHLLAAAVAYQVDTNAPLITQFARSLASLSETPEQIVNPGEYLALVSGTTMYWCVGGKQYGLITNIIPAIARISAKGDVNKLANEMKLDLAFAYLALENWQAALGIFQTYSNRAVFVVDSGLWGPLAGPVLTSIPTAQCRKELNLPANRDPREFELGKPCLCLHDPAFSGRSIPYWVESAIFQADASGIWVAGDSQLLSLDFDLQTNGLFQLDMASRPMCFYLAKDTIWIGTANDGLIEFDRATKKCRRTTETDGLLMNSVTQLQGDGETLWIGHGDKQGAGGLGKLDLRTRKITSFTPSFAAVGATSAESLRPKVINRITEPADRPTRYAISSLVLWEGEVWFISDSPASNPVRRFRPHENLWDGAVSFGRYASLVLGNDDLYMAQSDDQVKYGNSNGSALGVVIRDLRTGTLRSFPMTEGFLGGTLTGMAFDGKDLWVAGLGFIARLDPQTGKVLAFAYVPTQRVDGLQIAGGYLWASYDRHLYRAALNGLPR